MRNVFKVLFFVTLLTVLVISGCKTPPSGVILGKDVLIADAGISVANESDAVNVVKQNLKQVSEANLVRISGEINNNTLLNISAREEEGGDFQVHLEYRHPEARMEADTGKLVIRVTSSGKLFGSAADSK